MATTYDVFISHNHADKPWAHALADRLATASYNGRMLRPWLDEQFLDPGDAHEIEITTALDRSRTLVVVLSPESVASRWVRLELGYFQQHHDPDRTRITPLLLRACDELPELAGVSLVACDEANADRAYDTLVQRLCAPGRMTRESSVADVDAALEDVVLTDAGGLDAEPTPERDRLREVLLAPDIDDPALEGIALACFDRAATHLIRIESDDRAYNCKMLLGECLAAAMLRSVSYRQVMQRFLDEPSSTLLFVVVRALSKLAESSPDRVDPSVILRAATELDSADIVRETRATVGLLGRALGKLRDSKLMMLLIKMLTDRGPASRMIAAGAIAYTSQRGQPVYFTTGLPPAPELPPPSPLLHGELFALDLDQPEMVANEVRMARQELELSYPGIELSYGMSWLLTNDRRATQAQRAPFMGIVAKATVANMAELATKVGVRHVVCLTEPRVVDALFDRANAMLLPEQSPDTHLCRRLRSRAIPFAMLAPHHIAALDDDDHVVIDGEVVTLWRARLRERSLKPYLGTQP